MKDKEKEKESNLSKIAKMGLKTGIHAGKFVKKVAEEVVEDQRSQNKISSSTQTDNYKKRESKFNVKKINSNSIMNRNTTGISSVDEQLKIWQGWFYGSIIYAMIIFVSFMISSQDSRFTIISWILLLGYPFYIFKAVANSIPEIKIGNHVIFSRKDISYKDQLTFTKTIFSAFSREMFQNNPIAGFILFIFLSILVYVSVAPFF